MKEINAEKATILKTNEIIAENISTGQLPMFLTQSSNNHLSVDKDPFSFSYAKID